MSQFEICGACAGRGEKVRFMAEPAAGYQIPAVLVGGAEEGRTLLLTAGIHGDEYPGTAALIRLLEKLDPKRVKGNILLLPCVNVSGFWSRTPARVPEDGTNLNADYPGSPKGGVGARIAHYFVSEIFPKVDFIIDLHSGGMAEPLSPCLFFPAAESVRAASEAAARATDIPFLIASTASRGQYSYAASLGIPGLLLERGHSGGCREEWVRAYERDVLLLLRHLEMYQSDQPAGVCEKRVFNKALYLTAEEDGLWYPNLEEGREVKKGALLGRMEDFFGRLLREYRAEGAGTVLYYTSALAVKKGGALAAYGLKEFETK